MVLPYLRAEAFFFETPILPAPKAVIETISWFAAKMGRKWSVPLRPIQAVRVEWPPFGHQACIVLKCARDSRGGGGGYRWLLVEAVA